MTLFDQEKARKQRKAGRQPQPHSSILIWNDVIFRSFNVGNLRSIDFDFFKRLESSVAKRLYRFLGKRFFHRRKALAQERKRRDGARAKELVAREEAKRLAREQAISDFWQSVFEEERSRMGSEAMAQANALERDVLARGGAFATATRQSLLDAYALKMLQAGA